MPTKLNSKEPKTKLVSMGAPARLTKSDGDKTKAPNLTTLQSWWQYAYGLARKKHWEYFVIDQFLKGNHNIKGNPNDNTILVTKKSDTIFYPINKMYSTFRAVRGYVTRHKPKVDVIPSKSSDEAKNYARRANRLLERDNSLNNNRRLNKEWVYYGVKYGLGWRQIGYDQTKKVSIRWTIDPNDLWVGAKTGEVEDAPYLIKTLVRTVGYWKNKYPKADVSADNRTSAEEYKELTDEINNQFSQNGALTNDEQTTLGYECWYKLFEKNSLGGLVNKCLFLENQILDFQETPYTEYPFIPYKAEVSPNEMAPDGHMKHIISPQRLFNLLNTQLLEYNHIVNRGRFVKDKNAGFNAIFAKEGQIIEKNPGKSLQVLPPPPINPSLREQLTYSEQWIEDIGGQHDASMGAAPERVSSGRAIETLQLGDSNNIADLRDNFEDALGKEAAWILKMYSLFEKDGLVLEEEKKNGELDTFGIVGKSAYGENTPKKYYMEDNGTYCDICAVLPDNEVKVSVTSELGETKFARLDLLMRLVEMGLPFKTLLEYLEFPNTTDILERIAEESVADMMLEKTGQPPVPGVPPPPQGVATPGVPPPPPLEEEITPDQIAAIEAELQGA